MPQKKINPNSIGPRFVSNVVPWIETYYHRHKVFPSDSLLRTQFNMTKEKLDALNRSKLFKSALESRGIERRSHLTPTQVACISVVTNFADTRPQDIKLEQLGITPEVFQGWLSNPTFKRELAARADEILEVSAPDVLAVLASKARAGNMTAIRTYLEVTGRNQPKQEEMDAKRLVVAIVEAMQTHIKDPEILTAIHREILGSAPQVAQLPVANVVQEEVVEDESI